jgi:hypothetical protein
MLHVEGVNGEKDTAVNDLSCPYVDAIVVDIEVSFNTRTTREACSKRLVFARARRKARREQSSTSRTRRKRGYEQASLNNTCSDE